MPVLRFKAEDVRRVVEHSIAAPKQSEQVVEYVPHTTKPIAAPAVLPVHDQGVFLMSNGQPRDIVGADAAVCTFCAYAIGWTARGLVGGDEFVETLPWARKLKALIDGGARIITLRMTRDSIEIVHDRAPDRTRRKL